MKHPSGTRIAAIRYWLTPGLCVAAAVTATFPVVEPGLGAAPVPLLWPLLLAAAAACWLITSLRWPARVIMATTLVLLGWFSFTSSYPDTLHPGNKPPIVRRVDKALVAVDAGTWIDGITLVLVAAAVLSSWGRLLPSRPGLRTGTVAGVTLALIVAAAVPTGFAVRAASRAAIRSRAESVTHYHPARTNGVHQHVRIGKKHGWSRKGLRGVMPAGALTIGVRDNSVVGLRTNDGAKKWQYGVKHDQHFPKIDDVIVDDHSRTVQIRVEDALVGIGFDGQVKYHSHVPWSQGALTRLTGGGTGQQRPVLFRGRVVVFANLMEGEATYAYGYDVASGRKLWHVDTESRSCDLAAATHNRTGYILTAGPGPCRTRVLRFDGSSQRFDRRLKPPHGPGTTDSSVYKSNIRVSFHKPGSNPIPPAIHAVNADYVAVQPVWRVRSAKNAAPTQLLDSAGSVRGTLHGAPLSGATFPDSLLFPVRQEDATDGQRFGMLDASRKHGAGWALFDANLSQKSEHRVPATFNDVRRMGDYLDLMGKWRHHLRRIDDKLTRIETINTQKLPGCVGTRTNMARDDVYGNGDHLALHCPMPNRKHTYRFFVRPVS